MRAERLELEITEIRPDAEHVATLGMLRQLRELGVQIAMDDFGTGYSSLSYLRSFPFDKIKIDRSFIQDLSNGAEPRAIVHAVAGLAKCLNMISTAEGVEPSSKWTRCRPWAAPKCRATCSAAPGPPARSCSCSRRTSPKAVNA